MLAFKPSALHTELFILLFVTHIIAGFSGSDSTEQQPLGAGYCSLHRGLAIGKNAAQLAFRLRINLAHVSANSSKPVIITIARLFKTNKCTLPHTVILICF